jgi:hypothetical protein
MRDMSDKSEKLVRDRMVKLSGADRFIIGARMFESALSMTISQTSSAT